MTIEGPKGPASKLAQVVLPPARPAGPGRLTRGKALFSTTTNFDPFQQLAKGEFTCPTACREKPHDLEVKIAEVSDGATDRVYEVLQHLQLTPDKASVIGLVCDSTTEAIAGSKIYQQLTEKGYMVITVILPPNPAKENIPYADKETAEHVFLRTTHCNLLIGVGGGTVIDMTRLAAHDRKIPFISVPTAPSMNGFVSRIVAMEEKGIKTTKPATPPLAVICDTKILSEAPAYLRASGFGDLMSKPTSFSDWLMGYLVYEALKKETDKNYFCELPMITAKLYEAKCIELAEAIKRGDPEGIRILTLALINSGFSMIIAGSSSPASGGEHLISHLWDMLSEFSGRQVGLHGMQVGVATIMVAPLYEEILMRSANQFDWLKIRANYRTPADREREIRAKFPTLADEMIKHSAIKWRKDWPTHEHEVRTILANWEEIREALKRTTTTWQQIRQSLVSAGAVVKVRDIKTRTGRPANISTEEVKTALLYARFIRDRYTILDLASDLGILDEEFAERIFIRTSVLS